VKKGLVTRKFRAPRAKRRRDESGYALLLVVFLTTLVLLASMVAAPSVRTERKREKEEEMIWRGKQYVHAIKLYYRKNGRFPTKLDDLIKPQVGSLRYLRQAYKDPMNKEDGTWRLIYIGPAGQLIGSTKPPQTIQIGGAAPGMTQPGTPASALGTNPGSAGGSTFGSSFGTSFSTSGNSQQGAFGSQLGGNATGASGTTQAGAPGTPGAPGTGSTDASGAQNPNAPAPVDTSSFIGGNIIGIGSKATKGSVIIYEKATNYHQFEFIWDPSKDVMAIGGTGTQIGTPIAPGQPQPNQGFGQGLGTFGQPAQSPQPTGNPANQAPGQPTMPPLTNPQNPPQQQ
jgi:hypothetical protein